LAPVVRYILDGCATCAVILGHLRSAAGAFALDDKAPAEILQRLDDWLATMTDDSEDAVTDSPIVSCTYLVYDPWFGELTLANAGHWSPLMIHGEDVAQLEIDEGLMIDVRGEVPGLPQDQEENRDLRAGSTLIFTDGLGPAPARGRAGRLHQRRGVRHAGAAVRSAAPGTSGRSPGGGERGAAIDDDMAIWWSTASENIRRWDVDFPAEVSGSRRQADGVRYVHRVRHGR
jgi:hypothetical protein